MVIADHTEQAGVEIPRCAANALIDADENSVSVSVKVPSKVSVGVKVAVAVEVVADWCPVML